MQNREYQSGDLPPIEQTSELANPWARLAAVIIDILITSVPALTLILIAYLSRSIEDPSRDLIVAALAVSLVIFIIQMVLLGTRGQTIGKMVVRIRVVDAQSGEHPGWARLVLLRAILNGVLTSIPFLGLIYWLVDSLFIFRDDRRTVHDLYSGTRVDKL